MKAHGNRDHTRGSREGEAGAGGDDATGIHVAGEKDCVLLLMADAIGAQKGAILEANARDIENAEKRKLLGGADRPADAR